MYPQGTSTDVPPLKRPRERDEIPTQSDSQLVHRCPLSRVLSGPAHPQTRAEQKHKEKIRKLRSVQNAHVAELFDLPPDQAAKVAATTAKRRKLKAPS